MNFQRRIIARIQHSFGGLTRGERHAIFNSLRKIMATLDEANAKLDTIDSTMDAISADTAGLLQEIVDLKAAAANGAVPDALMARINSIAAKAVSIDQRVDALAPNPTPSPEVPGPTEGESV